MDIKRTSFVSDYTQNNALRSVEMIGIYWQLADLQPIPR
jgi:hypothetical protein